MDLSAYRINGETPERPSKPLILPPEPRRITTLLAVDQSLSASGYVLFVPTYGGTIKIRITGTLKSEGDLKGHEKTLQRANDLYWEFVALLEYWKPMYIVHETPPVGSAMMRPESSLLAAHSLRIAATQSEVIMIGAQAAKKRWTGNARASKKEMKIALEGFGINPKLDGMAWNEHIVDAASLGLLWLEGK